LSIEHNRRYIQIAFNGTLQQVTHVLPQIHYDSRIFIEAGTPYIKQFGMTGVSLIKRLWRGIIVADLKVSDGAIGEVRFTAQSGAHAVTAIGSAPVETLDFFDSHCKELGVYSMIDMIGVIDPLKKLLPLKHKPDFVIIHKGRDEESNTQNIIRYKDISKIRSKYDSFISVAGGLEKNDVREAYFNGANVAILNVVSQSDRNVGLLDSSNFKQLIQEILDEIGT